MARFPTNFAPFSRWFRVVAVTLALSPCLGWGSLSWETQQIQRTAKPGDKEVVALFPFKNTGTTRITIQDIQTTCECTVAELAKRVYAPGEGGELRVVFTLGDRTGSQDRVISVTTDDPNDRTTQLRLRLDIPAPLTWSARMVQWKVGASLDEKPLEVGTSGSARIAGVEIRSVTSPQVTVRAEPVAGGAKYRLMLKPAQLDQAGTVAINGVVRMEGGGEHPFTVYALVR